MGKTSTEVKEKYNKKTYDQISLKLRKEEDKELIDIINTMAEKEDKKKAVIVKEILTKYFNM